MAKVNPNNVALQNDFLNYLKSTHKSEGTIKGYKNDLDIFWVWVMENLDNKNFIDIKKRELVRFQNWLVEDNENSPARVRRIKAAISSMSNYIEAILDEEEEFKDFRSIVRKIESPALVPVREKMVWTEDELVELMDKLIQNKRFDQACYVALATYSGRRKAELARFKVSDFGDDHLVCDNALYKSSPILTKGGKMLECFTLAKKFKPYFDLWMADRKAQEIESEWLFPNPANPSEQINISTLDSWAIIFSKLSNKTWHVHALRHTFTTSLIRAHIPDNVIVEIIGWSSSEMLKVYDDTGREEKLSAYFKDGDIYIPESKGFSDV